MGDSGSQLIGFVLASLGLMASYKEAGTTIATVALPVLILAVPILDTTLVTALRLRSGRSVTEGGRDHTSHRLVYRGLSERRAVLFLVAVSAALGATSLAYAVLDSGRITTIGVLVTFALLLQFAAFLSGVAAAPGESGLSARASLLVDTLVDGALTVASFYTAYVIVVDGNGTQWQRHIFIWALPAVLLCRYLALWACGLYRRDRNAAKRGTLTRIAAAVVLSELVAYLFVTNTQTLLEFPAKIFVARRCDLLRLPRRRAVRRARRAEAVPLLAQARQHRDRVVTTLDRLRRRRRSATACSHLAAAVLVPRRSRASTSGRRRSIRHRGCSPTRSSTRRSRGRSPKRASRPGGASSTGARACSRG